MSELGPSSFETQSLELGTVKQTLHGLGLPTLPVRESYRFPQHV